MGYIAALLIGISLGLIGGGGSILTVPVLVYFFGISPLAATSYSLFVVGSTSLAGSIGNYRRGWVDKRTVLIFGLPSVITVFLIRTFLLPHLPESLIVASFEISMSVIMMVLFAVLMVASSLSMIKGKPALAESRKRSLPELLLYGTGVGLVTGLLGAGGGFLLIPALVTGLRLPMRKAVGSSLVIITINSLIGFFADAGHYAIEWKLLLLISLIAIAGVIAGGKLAMKIQGQRLRRGFGWFVLATGIAIIFREILQ